MSISLSESLFISIVILLTMIAINTILIMIIWNKVLIQKIKGANLQEINFWESLSIAVFFSLISWSTTAIKQFDFAQ